MASRKWVSGQRYMGRHNRVGQLSFITQQVITDMQYRSRSDISAQILEVAQEYSSPTKIMYGAYLSYSQLKEYLPVLIENGLLLEDYKGKSRLYKTTPKGLRFLNAYAQMDILISKNAIA